MHTAHIVVISEAQNTRCYAILACNSQRIVKLFPMTEFGKLKAYAHAVKLNQLNRI